LIVHRSGGQLRLVTQPDHAAFAADLLALMRLPGLTDHPRRDDLLRAVRRHDNGWRELDAAPPVDPRSGHPWDFRSLPAAHRLEVWERGTARYVESDPYVALLAHQHAIVLHTDRETEPGWAELLPRLAERRDELREHCGLSPAELAGDYAVLDLADTLSLAVCARWTEPFERHGVRGSLSGDDLLIAPFPFAGATTFPVSARSIPDLRYAGDTDLAIALAQARWQTFRVRLAPG
jgi:hypothetical protein